MLRLVALVMFAVLVAGPGCKEEPVEEVMIRPVRYTVVESSDTARERTFSGVARAGESSRLSFQVSGRVLEVPVEVGDRVKKGQTIARVDPSDFELELQNARASGAKMRALERNARANYARTRALYENQNASIQDLEADETDYQSARAASSSANQQVRLLQRQLEYTRLKAPAAGTIAAITVEANENVGSGEEVAILLVGDQIEVSVSVPGADIRDIHEGDAARVRLNALGGRELGGIVTEVGVSTGSGRTTFPVTVRLTEGQDLVRSGMAAAVTFSFARLGDSPDYSLPITAVGEDLEGRFVFVVERTGDNLGTVHRRPVRVGKLTSEGVEILEGVQSSDLIVTAGLSYLSEGLEVRMPPVPGSSPDNTAGSAEPGASSPNPEEPGRGAP